MACPWINEEFIQTAIRNGDGDSSATVESISVEAALPAGENYGSDMFRVKVKLHGETEERSLIVKIAPKGMEDTMKEVGAFRNETDMFCRILPKMYRLLEGKLNRNFHPFSARCLHAGDTPTEFIVLQDLSVSGFRTAARRKGLDYNHSILVIQSIARFHALSLALVAEDPHYLDGYKKCFFQQNVNITRDFVVGTTKCFVEELKNWPEEYSKYGQRMVNSTENLINKLSNDTNYQEGKFNVLNHGDLWSNNTMFKYKGDNPSAICFVDFQLGVFTSPALDLQYFLHTSPSEEVYFQCRSKLIAEYHSSLHQCLKLLGCPQFHISPEELEQHLDLFSFYGYYAALAVLPIIQADPAVADEVKDNMKDMGKGGGASGVIYKNESYMRYVLKLLPIFDEKGCFE